MTYFWSYSSPYYCLQYLFVGVCCLKGTLEILFYPLSIILEFCYCLLVPNVLLCLNCINNLCSIVTSLFYYCWWKKWKLPSFLSFCFLSIEFCARMFTRRRLVEFLFSLCTGSFGLFRTVLLLHDSSALHISYRFVLKTGFILSSKAWYMSLTSFLAVHPLPCQCWCLFSFV